MNENLENTQPTQIESTQPTNIAAEQPREPQLDDTQPIRPIKKRSRWRSFLTGFLGLLVLIGLGGYSGYLKGIGDRTSAEKSLQSQQLMDQYQLALVDFQFARYESARQRLEYILSKDPSYPGVAEKLTEVMVLSTIPTFTPTPTVTSTPDVSGVENAFLRAQQLVNAQDWRNALAALDIVRKLDMNYRTAQVDSMYYFSLRNFGQQLIIQEGNLEGGIYQFNLAERFGPLDNMSVQLRNSAQMYIVGVSFWELDWTQVINYMSQVNPTMWDGTMTAGDRLNVAYARAGDEYYQSEDYCRAYDLYSKATTLNKDSAGRAGKAYIECYPPTAVATDVPTAAPTP